MSDEAPVRILTDAIAVGEGGGGICTFLEGLLRGWADAGFSDEWHVFGMRDLPATIDSLVLKPGRVYRAGQRGGLRRLVAQQVVVPWTSRAARLAPDVIFATTPVIPALALAVPVVATVHDLRFLSCPAEFGALTRRYRRITYGYGLRRAAAVVAVSKFTRDEAERLIPGCRPPAVVYSGADHVDRWPAPTQGSGDGHGLTFGHWSNKRPERVIEAWAILRQRRPELSTPLHVVGTTSDRASQLRQHAVQHGVSDLVHLHPFLPPDQFQPLFASAAVVVLSSSTEGFGIPIVEAQRLGRPVVACPSGAVREAGGDAALYPADDSPTALAEECAKVLLDPALRAELIRRGRAHAESFTWKATAQQLRAVMVAAMTAGDADSTHRRQALTDARL